MDSFLQNVFFIVGGPGATAAFLSRNTIYSYMARRTNTRRKTHKRHKKGGRRTLRGGNRRFFNMFNKATWNSFFNTMSKGRSLDIDDAKHLLHVYHSFNKQYNYPTNKADQDDIHKMVADELNQPENSNTGDIHIDGNFVKDFLREIDEIKGVDIFINSAVENIISELSNPRFGISNADIAGIKDAISNIFNGLNGDYFANIDYRETFKKISTMVKGAIIKLLDGSVSTDTLNKISTFINDMFWFEEKEYEKTMAGDIPIANSEQLASDNTVNTTGVLSLDSRTVSSANSVPKRTWGEYGKSWGKTVGLFLTPAEKKEWDEKIKKQIFENAQEVMNRDDKDEPVYEPVNAPEISPEMVANVANAKQRAEPWFDNTPPQTFGDISNDNPPDYSRMSVKERISKFNAADKYANATANPRKDDMRHSSMITNGDVPVAGSLTTEFKERFINNKGTKTGGRRIRRHRRRTSRR